MRPVSPEQRAAAKKAGNDRYRARHPERVRESNKRTMAKIMTRDPDYQLRKTREWRARNPDKHREQERSREAAKKLALATRPCPGACEACGTATKLVWDHDHATGLFRGWICGSCNLALGHVGDSQDRLIALVDYLGGKVGGRGR